jgi:hypothetical protein
VRRSVPPFHRLSLSRPLSRLFAQLIAVLCLGVASCGGHGGGTTTGNGRETTAGNGGETTAIHQGALSRWPSRTRLTDGDSPPALTYVMKRAAKQSDRNH